MENTFKTRVGKIPGRHNQRGFLAFGLGVALFAVYSGIGAGVVATHDEEQDVAQASQTEMVAEATNSDAMSRPGVER